MESPYKKAPDSPSRQLLWELGRLSLSEQERLHERLDHNAVSQESLHRQALAAAASEHARIRQEAQVEQQKLEARAELARQIKRQDDLREIEQVKREKAEREATIQREKEEAEDSARRAEETRRRDREAKLERERQEREQTEQREAQRRVEEEERQRTAAEAEAKAKEAAIAARRKQAETPSASQPSGQQQQKPASPFAPKTSAPDAPRAASGPSTVNLTKEQEQAEEEHRRYLEIWKQLKELRNFVKEASKSNAELKKAMGDGRRMIRKCVGQLVTDSANPRANAQPNMEIRNVIRDSRRFETPTVPLGSFLFAPPSEIAQAEIPALFLYLLHIFAKCLVSQFLGEVAIAPQTATTIGITGATIFAQDDCRWQGLSLIDLFIAKYHRVCPVLFGICGDGRTQGGKQRLGWWWADESRTALATEQRHYERMTGLGAGFAAMTLRSYKNRASPYPVWHFWQAASRILNVPASRITDTHLVVLKSMVEGNEGRILDFFGRAGRALLRVALIEYPSKANTRDGVHAQALRLIPDVLRSEKRLFL